MNRLPGALAPAIAALMLLGSSLPDDGPPRRSKPSSHTRIVHGDTPSSSSKKKKKKKKKTAAPAKSAHKTTTLPPPEPAPAKPAETNVDAITDPSLQSPGSGSHSSAWSVGPGPQPAASPAAPTAGGSSGSVSPGAAPAPSAPAEKTTTAEAGVTVATPKAERTESWLEGAVELHMFSRSLGYANNTSQLPPYSLPFVATPAIYVAAYPGGLVSNGLVSYFGLSVQYERAFGLVSKEKSGSTAVFPTTSDALAVGAQARIPVDPFRFLVRLGYGWRSFVIDYGTTSPAPLVPSVDFSNVFVQGAARWKLHPRVAIDLEAGYHNILSAGQGAGFIESSGYFPKAGGGGIDASVGVTVMFHPVEVQLAGDIEHYFLNLNAGSSATLVAGTAFDDYFGARLSAWFGLF